MIERWLPIVGYEGRYDISNHGKVRSLKYRGTEIKKDLILTKNSVGYLVVGLFNEGIKQTKSVHRIVLESFNPPKDKSLICRHLNGDQLDNRFENLAWGSHSDNQADTRLHGRVSQGQDVHNSKLTNTQAVDIRHEYSQKNSSHRTLAKKYGVAHSTIFKVLKNRTYREINS